MIALYPPTPADAATFTLKFEDTFVDNRNHWETGDQRSWKGEVMDGAYTLEHKRKEFGWLVTRTMGFDPSGSALPEGRCC